MKELIYVGVDLEMHSLKNSPETNRVCADAASLPFPDGSFDLLTSNMVETPTDLLAKMQSLGEWIRKVPPPNLRSTLLAICMRREWT
jgi:hypothetical protein